MLRFSSLNKVLFIALLLSMVSSCRKDIDFYEGEKLEQGPINSNEAYYQPWIDIPTPGITNITLIEQDYNGVYFAGVQSGIRRVYYLQGVNNISNIWYGTPASVPNGEFTALVFSAPNMYIANNATPYASCKVLSSPTNISSHYTWYLGGADITGIKAIANDMYVCGDFYGSGGTSSSPSSNFFDVLDRNVGLFEGMNGLEAPVEEMSYGILGFFACGKNVHSGRSIANWDGSDWIPHSTLTERVTDIEMLGDTLLIAGNLPNGRAIMKERNGFEITFDELINTAQSEADTRIKFLRSGNVIYAYGTVNFQNATFSSVLKYQAGSWSYLGKLNEIPSDLAILDGYLYAATPSGIKKIKL